MKRLSGMDATFLYMETPQMHMHVIGVLLLDTSTMPGGYSFDKIRKMVDDRIHLMPAFRRRLVNVPFGLGHPAWIDDPEFDVENHLMRIGAPPPGDQKALADVVGEIASRPLDRGRPLWEMWVVEGLVGDQAAIVTKMHHATIDGASGADVMVHLLDLTPEIAEKPKPDEAFLGERKPGDLKLLTGALVTQVANPVRIVGAMGRATGNALKMVRAMTRRSDTRASAPFLAPRLRMSQALTSHRSVAFGQASLDDLKEIKNAFGAKVNDVVLAIATHALRSYLLAIDEMPEKPLVAACPISVRKDGVERDSANQVSNMLVPLPVQSEDPAEQLEIIVEATKRSKELANAIGAETLMDWAEFLAPRLFTSAMRFYSGSRLPNWHPPALNCIVSNVPGPPVPLYTAGARILAIYPMGPLLPGAGVNITVLSNMGNVDLGVIACRDTVPEVWRIADGLAEGVGLLLKAARERTNHPSV
ncbi:MAG: wax ester/triacylglycerol synthase family O-acyltransferase [Actinomycetota bacterium]